MYLNHQILNFAKSFSHDEWSGAVNLILVDGHIVFIKRHQNVPTHKGQIAFLGGHKEQNEDPVDTAKREFEEETSLNASDVEYHGYLGSVKTGAGKCIIPVVGQYKKDKDYFLKNIISNGEWDKVILVSLPYLADLKNWQRVGTNYKSGDLYFIPLMPENYITNDSENKSYTLWGATAKMIWYYFDFSTSNDMKG